MASVNGETSRAPTPTPTPTSFVEPRISLISSETTPNSHVLDIGAEETGGAENRTPADESSASAGAGGVRRSAARAGGGTRRAGGRLLADEPSEFEDTDSNSDPEAAERENLAKSEIDNLLWIKRTRRHRVALEEWEKKDELFAQRVDRKRKQSLSVKNEIYQLVGFYSVFQGVLLTAVSQSNLLHCNNWWSAFFLSAFASVVCIAGVIQKFRTIWSFEKTIGTEDIARKLEKTTGTEDITRKLCVSRVRLLRNLGPKFRFHKHAADGKEGTGKSRFKLRVSIFVVITVLILFSVLFLASIYQILCNPGYSLLPGSFPPSG